MNRNDYEKFLEKKVNVMIETPFGKELFLYGYVTEISEEHLVLSHPKFGLNKIRYEKIVRIYERDREVDEE